MRLRVARGVMILLATVALYLAFESYYEGVQLRSRLDADAMALSALTSDIAMLRATPEKPLRGTEDTVDDFLGRLLEDTELLGSSVRLDLKPGGMLWVPVRLGVQKADLSLSSASETEAAMGYFTLLWELIKERPVSVRGARINVGEAVSWFTIDVELFALAGEGS
jgi:hypothetical protein